MEKVKGSEYFLNALYIEMEHWGSEQKTKPFAETDKAMASPPPESIGLMWFLRLKLIVKDGLLLITFYSPAVIHPVTIGTRALVVHTIFGLRTNSTTALLQHILFLSPRSNRWVNIQNGRCVLTVSRDGMDFSWCWMGPEFLGCNWQCYRTIAPIWL